MAVSFGKNCIKTVQKCVITRLKTLNILFLRSLSCNLLFTGYYTFHVFNRYLPLDFWCHVVRVVRLILVT